MNDPMYFYQLSAHDIEDKIRFNDEDAIPIFPEFHIPRQSTQLRMLRKKSNLVIEFLDKRHSTVRALLRNKIIDSDQIVLRDGQIPDSCIIGH
jgi:hypothetical protein